MIDVRIVVPIPPLALPRSRTTRNPKTGRVHGYMPARAMRWQSDVAAVAAAYLPKQIIDEPVRVAALFVVPRPKYMLGKKFADGLIWACQRPDCDNFSKGLLDSLRSFWRDDALVVCLPTMKAYAERTGRARVVFRIASQTEPPEAVARRWGLL